MTNQENDQMLDQPAINPETGENSRVARVLRECQDMCCVIQRTRFNYRVDRTGFITKDVETGAAINLRGDNFVIEPRRGNPIKIKKRDLNPSILVTMAANMLQDADIPFAARHHITRVLHLALGMYEQAVKLNAHQKTLLRDRDNKADLTQLFNAVSNITARTLLIGGVGEILDTSLTYQSNNKVDLEAELLALEACLEIEGIPTIKEEIVIAKQLWFGALTKLGYGRGFEEVNIMVAEITHQIGEAVGVEVSDQALERGELEGASVADIQKELDQQ